MDFALAFSCSVGEKIRENIEIEGKNKTFFSVVLMVFWKMYKRVCILEPDIFLLFRYEITLDKVSNFIF